MTVKKEHRTARLKPRPFKPASKGKQQVPHRVFDSVRNDIMMTRVKETEKARLKPRPFKPALTSFARA